MCCVRLTRDRLHLNLILKAGSESYMATTGTPRTPGPSSSPTRRNGRRTAANRRSPFRSVKIFFQVCATLILLGILAATAIVAIEIRNAPTAVDLDFDPPGRIQILSSDGTPLAQISTQNRQVVGIDKIPTDLQHATIAFEDKRFYEHSGVDIVGTLRALVRNISTGDLKGQGGSTITQQLARNLGVGGLTMQKTFQRKVHEWVVSNQIEKNYTKQQILGMYLNAVNYGSGAYGV